MRAVLGTITKTVQRELGHFFNDPLQKKFAVLLLFVTIALISIQIDISREIDTNALIRIHVLGNSNSDSDQAIKITVKDAVVSYLAPQLESAQSLEESRKIIKENMNQIAQIANETLAKQGCNKTVTMQYGIFDFPVKYYGGFSLPAGRYEALRILIGEAKGQNWWCVLFPPLCFTDCNVQSAASEATATHTAKYTDELPEQKIIIKWRGKELWNNRIDKITNQD